MTPIYEILKELCLERGISGGRMCRDLGLSRSFMTELKMGRAKSVTLPTASLIAGYFGVPVESLLGDEGNKLKKGEIISVEESADRLLSVLLDTSSDTLMLDGNPVSPEAVQAFRNAVMVGVELARKVNNQKKEE